MTPSVLPTQDYVSCFLGHFVNGAELVRGFHDAGKPAEAKEAAGICVTAKEMVEYASEARSLSNIFEVLDAKGRGAVLSLMQDRMNEIAQSAQLALSWQDRKEIGGPDVLQLEADANRFIETLLKARALALVALSAG